MSETTEKLATLESSNLKKVAVNHHSLPTFIGRPHVKDIEEALRFWGGAEPKHWEDQWFSIEQCAQCNQRVDLLGSPWCPLFCWHEGWVERHTVYPGRASSLQESGWKHHRVCYENSIWIWSEYRNHHSSAWIKLIGYGCLLLTMISNEVWWGLCTKKNITNPMSKRGSHPPPLPSGRPLCPEPHQKDMQPTLVDWSALGSWALPQCH